MKAILVTIALCLSLTTYSQSVTIPQGYEANENLRELGSLATTGNVMTFDTRYQGVKGTPFIFEEWVSGEVFLSDKKRVFFNDMNYNCFDNEIAYTESTSNKTLLMNKYIIDLFVLYAEDTLTFVPVNLPGKDQHVYAQLLYNQKSNVYKLYKKEFLRADYEGGYSADRKYDEFIDKSDLYFMKHDENILYKVRNSKKYILEAFEDQSDAVSKFIKAKKLNFKETEDVIQLLQFYDTL